MPRKKVEKKAEKAEDVKIIPQEIKKHSAHREHKEYIYAVGRRKSAVARVRLFHTGNGEVIINGKDVKVYFPYFEWTDIIASPLLASGKSDNFHITVKVKGGGVKGQSEAVRHGISRALIEYNPDLRKTLKPLGFLKRDPREKERKKPGRKGARRSFQFTKR